MLWRQPSTPNTVEVFQAWFNYVKQQAPWIVSDFSKLKLNRRKVLQALAAKPTHELHGMEFLKTTSISPGSIRKILEDLLSLDMIYKDENSYVSLLDPAMAFYHNQQGYSNSSNENRG